MKGLHYKNSVIDRLGSNRQRSILIIIGILLSIICMITSQFISYAMRDITLVSFANTDNNTIILDTENAKFNREDVVDLGTTFKQTSYNAFSERTGGMISLGDSLYNINIIEIYNLSDKMLLPSVERFGATERTSIIAGRLPSKTDYELERNVAIIHRAVAEFIFGENSSYLGNKILVNKEEFIIVGIIADSPDIVRLINKAKNEYGKSDATLLTLPIFTTMHRGASINEVFLFFPGPIGESGLDFVRQELTKRGYENVYATNLLEQQQQRISELSNSEQLIEIILNVITAIMCLVSVLIIFFSVKERASEIAIRKTFGATTLSIVSMFLTEVMLCIFIAVSYALPITLLIMLIISSNISAPLGLRILPLNFNIFAMPIVLICAVICIGSLLPLVHYSRCKIVDGLKVV